MLPIFSFASESEGKWKLNLHRVSQNIEHHVNWDAINDSLYSQIRSRLISVRVYKAAFSHEKAVNIIKDARGSHFAPDMVDALWK